MNNQACPKCGGPVHVDCGGEGTCCHMCPRCGPVDPAPSLVKVFPGGGPLLGQAMADAATQSHEGWE